MDWNRRRYTPMRTASIVIVALLMMNTFAAAASATLMPTNQLGQHDGALQPSARSQDVLPLWGAPPGPYGPSNLTLQFKSPAFNGTPSFTRLANLDGDGDKDTVFATMNDSGYLNISAIDSTTHTMMWSNTSVNAGGFFFGAQVGDYRGIGRDDIFLTYMDGFCMLFGSNGTKAWSKAVSFSSSQNFADINADGAPEFLYYDMMSSDRGIALNTTTGAKVWNSTTVGGMSFQVGNVDNDTQYEIIYVYDDWGNGKHNVMVYDAVSNKTEWQVNFTVMISPGVRDWDADGRHEIIVCDYLATPNRLTLLDINGSQVWTSNSYQARTWFNRMWNSDNDANLEIINSDPDTHDIEIIDGGTGVSQGYWTCTTYAPSDTWELPVDVDGTRYIASMGGSAGNFAVTVFWGSNLTMQHQYKFTEMTSMRIINDTDGNGFSEAIFTSWGGNVSVYNFTSHSLVWKRGGLGTLWGLNPAWILGDMAPSGKKLMDMAAVTCRVTNVCNISFFNATDGIITNSTVQYQGGTLQIGDMDNDGGSEVVFTEVNYTGTNHTVIHILKATVPPTLNDTIPTITINEDSTNTHALDLESVFLFNKATTTMTYSIVPPTGTAYVTPTQDGKWVNIATAVLNWNGNTSINISASRVD